MRACSALYYTWKEPGRGDTEFGRANRGGELRAVSTVGMQAQSSACILTVPVAPEGVWPSALLLSVFGERYHLENLISA